MTLSRRAIRPFQTQHLLDNGILPVSLDYRLCPEITITDGPFEDMRDALIWARDQLPSLAKSRGCLLDTEKLIIIGWSTGGHLAMTSAWLSQNAGLQPPKAILSFYGPTDFMSECEPLYSTSLLKYAELNLQTSQPAKEKSIQRDLYLWRPSKRLYLTKW